MTPEIIIASTLGPMVLLIIQAIKTFVPDLGRKAIAVNFVLAIGFSALLVEWSDPWQAIAIALATYTLAISGVASGVYSWGKTTVTLEDYIDEK